MELIAYFKGFLALSGLGVIAIGIGWFLSGPKVKKVPRKPDPTPNSTLRTHNRPLSHSINRRRATQNRRSDEICTLDRAMYHRDTVTDFSCDTGRFSSGGCGGSDFGSSGGSSCGSSSSSSCGSDD